MYDDVVYTCIGTTISNVRTNFCDVMIAREALANMFHYYFFHWLVGTLPIRRAYVVSRRQTKTAIFAKQMGTTVRTTASSSYWFLLP